MIQFLLKGLLRDRQKSLFPILIVAIGVMLTVLMHCWVTGIFGDMIDYNAKFSTGHVKIMSQAYAENTEQIPNDLALLGIDKLMQDLKKEFPKIDWVRRIRFGGLIDVPDQQGETKSQGPAIGLALDVLSAQSTELHRLNIKKALVTGNLPEKSGEILISNEFANKLGIVPGDTATIISSTMYGSMAIQNYNVVGTVIFGIEAMDRGAVLIDISDAETLLNMENGAGEILGYFSGYIYDDEKANKLTGQFNRKFADSQDEFSPIMFTLKEQYDLAGMIDYINKMKGIFVFGFIVVMSIVLWNAGLIGGLRRYGELGVRLAIGEEKGHVYRSMIFESVMIGFFGSIIGTLLGLGFSYILQTKGIDVGDAIKNATTMLPTTFRANITGQAYYIGFFPGIFSTVLGTALSGIGIYRRNTAQLFKELEA